ncbi:hypothetical protein J2S40_003669 [Nocardioides luteus]|uniref:Uncharacterized protein n=1 Tax=Nocardioides luteus TaxID=1844 RepID=A0ABQ5SXY5_9ACTN|nr:hypothetical protein [Nocardioides luteus]MDR7312611.1 hypothetical protein [Nocardioides luteus]GGR46285.1 hypothetical protein GCM10010197_09950 [Nocardioides luteus]GLJ68859.1 hypothetical protein GCM10017579_28950 [Nocardioides luteus]
MSYVVLVAWLVQAAAGAVLLTGWLRHGRVYPRIVLTHVAISVIAVACWITYVLTDRVLWGWVAFGLLNIGNALGDTMLLRRTRRLGGSHLSTINAYKLAVRSIFKRRLPVRVGFHAIFAGVVYFSSLAICLVDTFG